MSTLTINNESILSSLHMQDRDTLSERLSQALRLLGISQSELARRIGVKPQAIQYLCTSNAARSKFAFDIADALGINADWLTAGHGKMTEKNTAEKTTRVPLIEWVQITNWFENNDRNIKPVSHVNTQLNFAEKCYALKINDSSMTPRFEMGTILIIDCESTPRENDFIIIATKFSETPILRQLIKRAGKLILMPANTALYKEIPLSDEDKHFGVLRQTIYEFIRR